MDGHDIFSHWFVVRIVMFVWKDKNKRKRGVGWTIKKIKKETKQVQRQAVPSFPLPHWLTIEWGGSMKNVYKAGP